MALTESFAASRRKINVVFTVTLPLSPTPVRLRYPAFCMGENGHVDLLRDFGFPAFVPPSHLRLTPSPFSRPCRKDRNDSLPAVGSAALTTTNLGFMLAELGTRCVTRTWDSGLILESVNFKPRGRLTHRPPSSVSYILILFPPWFFFFPVNSQFWKEERGSERAELTRSISSRLSPSS